MIFWAANRMKDDDWMMKAHECSVFQLERASCSITQSEGMTCNKHPEANFQVDRTMKK